MPVKRNAAQGKVERVCWRRSRRLYTASAAAVLAAEHVKHPLIMLASQMELLSCPAYVGR